MRLSELQSKYIVNVMDGKNIGNIIDVRIDDITGAIVALIIEPSRNIFSFSRDKNGAEIKWQDIKKIGEDVILVNTKDNSVQ